MVEPIEYLRRGHRQGLGAVAAKPKEKHKKRYIKPGESREEQVTCLVSVSCAAVLHCVFLFGITMIAMSYHFTSLLWALLVSCVGSVNAVRSTRCETDVTTSLCCVTAA